MKTIYKIPPKFVEHKQSNFCDYTSINYVRCSGGEGVEADLTLGR